MPPSIQFLPEIFDRLSSLDTNLESGFFLIGFRGVDSYIVYDAIEFMYFKRSEAFVASSPTQRALLELFTIPGAEVLGVLHTHPFTRGKPAPSVIDSEDFAAWEEGIFVIVSGTGEHFCLVKSHGNDWECSIEVLEDAPPVREAEIPLSTILYIERPSPIFAARELAKIGSCLRFSRESFDPLLLIDISLGSRLKYRIRIAESRIRRLCRIVADAFGLSNVDCSAGEEINSIESIRKMLRTLGINVLAVRRVAKGGEKEEETRERDKNPSDWSRPTALL